jgi:hypothetical protein
MFLSQYWSSNKPQPSCAWLARLAVVSIVPSVQSLSLPWRQSPS